MITRLFANHPNPFNPSTSIRYQVSGIMGQGNSHVQIDVYNVRGQLIRSLVNEEHKPGEYRVVWNGTDDRGQHVSSGIYFYVMRAGDFVESRRMILLK